MSIAITRQEMYTSTAQLNPVDGVLQPELSEVDLRG
jgi:hypothetical protein